MSKSERKESLIFGAALQFKEDPLKFLLQTSQENPISASFHFAHRPMHMISDPSMIQHVFQKNYENYRKGLKTQELRHCLGNGIAISTGQTWKKHRKLIQPAFMREKVVDMGEATLRSTYSFVEKWTTESATEQTYEIFDEMKELTMNISGETLFSHDFTEKSRRITEALTFLLDHISGRIGKAYNVPIWFPGGGRGKFKNEKTYIDEIVKALVSERRINGSKSYSDLLAMFLETKDENGIGLSDEEIRDEIVTMFVSATDSSAVALAWIVYILSFHKEEEELLRKEIRKVAGNQPLTLDKIRQLKRPRAIINETLRLYPPFWLLARQALENDQINGLKIKKGDGVLVSPYALHRSPEHWSSPNLFKPERFMDDQNDLSRSKHFMPFGTGPRFCVGNHFAMMEMEIIIAVLYNHFTFDYLGNKDMKIEIGFSLRPKEGIIVKPKPLS